MRRSSEADAKVLVVDVGGSHVKCVATDHPQPATFRSGMKLTPQRMMKKLSKLTADWEFDAVSVGYPGVVRRGEIAREPHNLPPGWIGFDFRAAFDCPVRIVNDAAMQALGSYRGGTMLFLGLGTGLGSALIVDGTVAALELGHLHAGKHTYEHFLGNAGRKRLGHDKWRRTLDVVVEGLRAALLPDDVVLGGGNVRKLRRLPPHTRRGDNDDAFTGGFRVWKQHGDGAQRPPENRSKESRP
jgi:polyphosphate glucokinase